MSSEPSHSDTASRRGLILVLSSPSGAGKTSISRAILDTDENIRLSISVTTRPRRASEVDGVHYHFIEPAAFDRMRGQGALLEWARVHGNLYGTPLSPVTDALQDGEDILFDIDWQGTQQVRKKLPNDVVSVFILPPSMQELRARLERRAQDAPDVIRKRLEGARDEIVHWSEYEYVIVNRDLEDSVRSVEAILTAERLARANRKPSGEDQRMLVEHADRLRARNQPELEAFADSLVGDPAI
jgi:guanylate kinase